MDHPIEGLMATTLQNIREMVDVNTVVGQPIITPDGTTVIPVSKVSFGFAAGGSDFAMNSSAGKPLFGGGGGAGVSIDPIAFLIVSDNGVKLLEIGESSSAIEKIAEIVPFAVDKAKEFFRKRKQED